MLLLGPPGVGKTHLAFGLGIAATEAGYRTYFTSAQDLVRNLQMSHLEGRWGSKMRTYTGPSVLVIDELGYLPMDQTSAHWIFEVVTRRYERGSIVLTSNRGFTEWGQVFADALVASAILDRLLHHADGDQRPRQELPHACARTTRRGSPREIGGGFLGRRRVRASGGISGAGSKAIGSDQGSEAMNGGVKEVGPML